MTKQEHKESMDSGNSLGNPELSKQELKQRVDARSKRFVESARRAAAIHRERKAHAVRLQISFRRIGTMAATAAVVLLVVGAFWLAQMRPGMFPPLVDVAEAGSFTGVNAVIISSFDRHCVGNVFAYEQTEDSRGGVVEKYSARSDSSGILIIPPDDGQSERHYVLKHDGLEVGEIRTGTAENHVSGYQRIQVGVALEHQLHEFHVTLKPGETTELSAKLRIGLGEESETSWTGTLTLDDRWPPEFNHGNVLAGILTVSGDVNPALQAQLSISDEIMEANGATPDVLALIANSQEYDRIYRTTPDFNEYWKALCHRGWYDCGDPPEDFLERETHSVQLEDSEYWVSFTPVPDRKYAIKAPLNTEWEAGTVLIWNTSLEYDRLYPLSSLLSHFSPSNVNPIYDVKIVVDGHDEDFFLPVYPKAHFTVVGLWDTLARGYYDPPQVLVDATSQPNYLYKYWVRQMDFTLSEISVKGPFTVSMDPEPGKYAIEFEPPKVGYVTKLRLTGDLDRISGRPAWDFDGDKNADAFGIEVEYLVTQIGSHRVYALIPEKDSLLVQVSKQLNCSGDGILAYVPSGGGPVPYVLGNREIPKSNSSIWVISPESLGNRMNTSLNVMGTCGPNLHFDPQENLVGKRIKEVRLSLFASPRGGDIREMLIRGSVYPVSKQKLAEKQVSWIRKINVLGDAKPFEMDTHFLTSVSLDYQIYEAFTNNKYLDHPEPMREHWMTFMLKENSRQQVKDRVGFEIENPPEEAELTRILFDYWNSPEFIYKNISEEKQEVNITFDMQGMLITEDTGLSSQLSIQHQNRLYTIQYEVYSGPDYPSRLEIETTDGDVYTTYYDYSTFPGANLNVE